MFKNRTEAGILLAEKLKSYAGVPGIILAVPRGGVPVAYAVAKELGMPLDIVLTKKITKIARNRTGFFISTSIAVENCT